jgi:hypothetical protein
MMFVKGKTMGNSPKGLLAIWNDFDPGRLLEYEHWHTLEHVPERVWVPGMVGGRRYRAVGQSVPRYLTLYELETLDVLERAEYVDLVVRPTPWSASMRPSFSNFQRHPCEILADSGVGNGGKLAVIRTSCATSLSPAALRSFADNLLTRPSEQCVVRVRVGQVISRGPQALANHAAIVEGIEYLWAIESVDSASADLEVGFEEAGKQAGVDTRIHYVGVFEFLTQIDHMSVKAENRPPPRLDLMKQFAG